MIRVGDVVQFTENHRWVGCLGIVTEDKAVNHPHRYLIAVNIPDRGTAYMFDSGDNIERIGRAILVPAKEEA